MQIPSCPYIDLHTHTTASDGSFSPDQLVNLAVEKGLSAIAITDHDCLMGIEPALCAAQDKKLEVVPGIEISIDHPAKPMHILGLYIDYLSPALTGLLDFLVNSRYQRNQRIVEKLQKLGFDISMADVASYSTNEVIGRPHIATCLVKTGQVESQKAVFNDLIGYGCPAYSDREKLSSALGFKAISQAGGIPIIAHPGQWKMPFRQQIKVLDSLIEEEVMGLEAYYSQYSKEREDKFLLYCRKNRILASGGSDFHGIAKPDVHLGVVGHNRRVPYQVLKDIKTKLSI